MCVCVICESNFSNDCYLWFKCIQQRCYVYEHRLLIADCWLAESSFIIPIQKKKTKTTAENASLLFLHISYNCNQSAMWWLFLFFLQPRKSELRDLVTHNFNDFHTIALRSAVKYFDHLTYDSNLVWVIFSIDISDCIINGDYCCNCIFVVWIIKFNPPLVCLRVFNNRILKSTLNKYLENVKGKWQKIIRSRKYLSFSLSNSTRHRFNKTNDYFKCSCTQHFIVTVASISFKVRAKFGNFCLLSPSRPKRFLARLFS